MLQKLLLELWTKTEREAAEQAERAALRTLMLRVACVRVAGGGRPSVMSFMVSALPADRLYHSWQLRNRHGQTSDSDSDDQRSCHFIVRSICINTRHRAGRFLILHDLSCLWIPAS